MARRVRRLRSGGCEAVLLGALLVLGSQTLGCQSGGGSGRAGGRVYGAQFPSEAEVRRIEAAPPPSSVFDEDLRNAPEWVHQAAAPDLIAAAHWLDESPWSRVLGEHAAKSGGRLVPTQAMHCVAREYARFALERDGQPDHSVRRFMTGVCNASAARPGFAMLQGEAKAQESEEDLFGRWEDRYRALLQKTAGSGRRVIGAAIARVGDRAALYVVYGRPSVELEPVATLLGPGQRFELRGRALEPAASIGAMITHGYFGVKECEPVGDVAPPAFHVACEPDPSDVAAWVTLAVTPPNRVLATAVLEALVWPGGRIDPVYRRFVYAEPRRVASADVFGPSFTEELNGVRRRAGLRPVTLDTAQSDTAARIAPHFFAAMYQDEIGQDADVLALSMLAGWNVEGTIRSGGFSFGAAPQTDDLSVLLSTMLESPLGRSTVLDPEVERLAVGPIVSEVGGAPLLAAVVGGYALFHAGSGEADAERLLALLAAERRKRELPPPYRLVGAWANVRTAAASVGGGADVEGALDDVMTESVAAVKDRISGWYAESSELEEIQFPDEYLNAPRLGIAIGVSHRKGPDEAWGRYVVMLVANVH